MAQALPAPECARVASSRRWSVCPRDHITRLADDHDLPSGWRAQLGVDPACSRGTSSCLTCLTPGAVAAAAREKGCCFGLGPRFLRPGPDLDVTTDGIDYAINGAAP